MLPFILLLLFQSISAVEFPHLTEFIDLIWNDAAIFDLHGPQTTSLNGHVSAFTLCGSFNSEGKDASCKISYYAELDSKASPLIHGVTYGTAKAVSHSEDYSCMEFPNKIADFPRYFEGGKYYIHYICSDAHPDLRLSYSLVIIIMVIGGVIGCEVYNRKRTRDLKEKEAAYNAFEKNNDCGDFEKDEVYERRMSGIGVC